MFTGLIEGLGTVSALGPTSLEILWDESIWPNDPIQIGESIAVNGCCLTALNTGSPIRFDLSEETLRRTAFGSIGEGDRVNLERAAKLGSRLGGHLVQGHVDATGQLKEISERPDGGLMMTFDVNPDFDRYLIDKGSIAVDGISLTVVNPRVGLFDVWVVPHTRAHTNLGAMAPGQSVHIEFDMLAKHVENLLNSGWVQV